jgi:hypothetical protein
VICARCKHFTSQVPPEQAAMGRGECTWFLAGVMDYVRWDAPECRKFREADPIRPREVYIRKMEALDAGESPPAGANDATSARDRGAS